MKPVELITLQPGEMLYRQGDHNKDAYIVAAGDVVLFRTFGSERREYEIRGSGSVIGELSVLTDNPRSVNVQAKTHVQLIKVPASQINASYETTNPLLRTCIDTAISFTAQLTAMDAKPSHPPPRSTATLTNAADVIDKYQFEIDLLESIENGNFSMVYQPIVTLQSGQIVGFEALMRWNHPTRGFVPPDHFITAAEDMGVIETLTLFALEQSCETLTDIARHAPHQVPIFASINVSGHDVARPGFYTQMADILDAYNIAPSQIKLEVTETAIMPDNEDVLDNLMGLEALGCGLSIDDFGTGYSNLAHLKSIPMTALKIDRAFAGDAHSNPVSSGIVAMLVGLGAALEVDIVAEGVETDADVDALSDLGCSYAQGYFFYRPIDRDDLLTLIGNQNGLARPTNVA